MIKAAARMDGPARGRRRSPGERGLHSYEVETYGPIRVFWTPELNGGGSGYGQQFVPVARLLFGRVGRLFEFCAGPGFIGFAMLAEGLCETLCLADVNPRAVAALRRTVEENELGDRVTVYQSDGLDAIPSTERWDLVVSNPPHFARPAGRGIVSDDPDWALHRRFYAGVGRFLAPAGNVLVQENYVASREDDFLPMIEAGGLVLVDSFMAEPEGAGRFNPYYFLRSRRAHRGIVPGSRPPLVLEVIAGQESVLRIDRGTKYAIGILNEGLEPISARLFDEGGRALSLVPLAEAGPGERVQTRPFLLTAGRFLLRDSEGRILAELDSA